MTRLLLFALFLAVMQVCLPAAVGVWGEFQQENFGHE